VIGAGSMDRRVTVQQKTVTKDVVGGKVESWATHATVWAKVADLNGRALYAAQAAGSVVTKEVTIRYLATLNAAHRLLLPDGRLANIRHIEVLGRNEAQRIYCEVVNG